MAFFPLDVIHMEELGDRAVDERPRFGEGNLVVPGRGWVRALAGCRCSRPVPGRCFV